MTVSEVIYGFGNPYIEGLVLDGGLVRVADDLRRGSSRRCDYRDLNNACDALLRVFRVLRARSPERRFLTGYRIAGIIRRGANQLMMGEVDDRDEMERVLSDLLYSAAGILKDS